MPTLEDDSSSEDFVAFYGELSRLVVEMLLTCLRHEIASSGGIGCAWQTDYKTIHVRLLCIETESAVRRLLTMVRQLDPEILIQGYKATRSGCILEICVNVAHARLDELGPLSRAADVPAY